MACEEVWVGRRRLGVDRNQIVIHHNVDTQTRIEFVNVRKYTYIQMYITYTYGNTNEFRWCLAKSACRSFKGRLPAKLASIRPYFMRCFMCFIGICMYVSEKVK